MATGRKLPVFPVLFAICVILTFLFPEDYGIVIMSIWNNYEPSFIKGKALYEYQCK
jgi:hypothetical protein